MSHGKQEEESTARASSAPPPGSADARSGTARQTIGRGALQSAVASADAGMWEWDIKTGEIRWSDTVEGLFGLAPGAFDGSYAGYLSLLGDDRAIVESAVAHTLETGEPYRVEHRVETSAAQRWLVARSQLLRDAHGNPALLRGLVADITARKASERALAESEARFRAFAEATFEGIAFSVEGVLVDVNDTICRMFGYEPGALVGVKVQDLVAPDDVELVREHMRRGYEGAYRHRVVKRDGSLILVEARGRMLNYKGQEARITALRDLSDEERQTAQRQRLESQLQQAQKMEAVGQLSGGIAHDFNNILSVILGNLELAKNELATRAETAPVAELLEEASKAANKAASLTAQLLAFSRRQPHRPRPVDLNDVVREMRSMLARVLYENITLTLKLEAELGTVRIDSGQIQQVLMNLVVNARDAMPQGGEIVVSTANVEAEAPRLEPCVALRVSDNGSGMSAETLAHIFEPFYTTKPVGQGTGLGLSVAYGIIEQSGGKISARSTLDEGTTFDIILPRYGARAEPLSVPLEPAEMPVGSEVILVCEDDAQVRTLMRRFLAEAGYVVLEAQHGEQALEVAASVRQVHLLITDVVLPGVDGKQVSSQLELRHPGVRTLFCSGYASNVTRQRGVLAAKFGFLPKPFTKTSLLTHVRAVLDRV